MKIHAFAILTALALPALATADTGTTATDTATKLTADETKTVAHLHHVNQMEIDMGKLAQKTSSAGVKSYGETLVTDHTSADKDLTALAKKHGLSSIPADKPMTDADRQDDKDMTASIAHLKMLKGPDFDKEFLNMMVTGHDKELTKIDPALSAAVDPELQAMLKTVKPMLQRHADQARDLQKNLQTPSASSTSPTPAPTR
jgi:putative membrane protein